MAAAQISVRPVRVASLPRMSKITSAANSTTPSPIPAATMASQRTATRVAGPRRTMATKTSPPSPRIKATSEVLEVDIRVSSRASPANPHHMNRRWGLSMAAAPMIANPSAILPPSAFFSDQTPRHAPGKISCMMPTDGKASGTRSEITARMAKAVPAASASSDHFSREASTTPPSAEQ